MIPQTHRVLGHPHLRPALEPIPQHLRLLRAGAGLEREKAAVQRLWVQREQHIDAVAANMLGMHRDLKTIAGTEILALPDVDTADEVPAALGDTAEVPDAAVLCRKFVEALQGHGGRAGNLALRTTLGWCEADYDRTKDRLVTAGIVVLGRGRGGAVALRDDGVADPLEGGNGRSL